MHEDEDRDRPFQIPDGRGVEISIRSDVYRTVDYYRALLEHASDALITLGAHGRIIDCNARAEELFGRPRTELFGKRPRELAPPVQPGGRRTDSVGDDLLAAAMEGRPQLFEWRFLRKDGDPFDTEVSFRRIDVGGEYFLHAAIRDVTVPRRARRAIEESERRLDLALQGAALSLWDLEPVTGAVRFDQRLARMLSLPPTDIPNTIEAWRERIHPDDLEPVIQAMTDHLRGLTPVYSVEHRVRNGQGRWHRVHCRGRVVERREDGTPTRVAGVQENLEPDTPSYLPPRRT